MKITMQRDISTTDILLRVTNDIVDRFSLDAYAKEMRRAIEHFVATDPECQVLINEMTKEAFKGIDLLAVITETVKAKVEKSVGAKPPNTP